MTPSRIASLFLVPAALLAAASAGWAQNQNLYIPQIADGGSWQTTLVITNTGSAPAPISFHFYQEIAGGTGGTQAWSLGFMEPVPSSVPAASTILLHTFGTSALITTGWGEVTAGPGIQAYGIFTQRIAGRQDQDGTGLALPAASRFLVPFDQTAGSVVGLAFANTSNSNITVNMAVRTTNGTVTQAAITVPPLGHYNFAFNSLIPSLNALKPIIDAVTGQSGLLEIYTSSASLAVLTLRFNFTAAFTAAPVYPESGPPVIGSGNGSTAAPFTELYVNGTWTLTSTASPVIINVTPNSDGTTYKAVVVSQQPTTLVSFPSGTLSGNTLTFGSPASLGLFGTTTSITGGSLSLTVSNFNQVGTPVTGTLVINSSGSTGDLTGTSTYQP